MSYTAIRCPCGHPSCKNWMVDDVAAIQGVAFTEKQAKAVAALLTAMDAEPNMQAITIVLDNPTIYSYGYPKS